MKPLKLTINAFGPYAKPQEIDFTKMDSIYLITGPTGAGKTTIFDAISFALFGETSGSDREQKDLKSDFADGGEVTFVELEFLLHGEIYTIRREPTQTMKGRKTKRNHAVELHLPNEKLLNKVHEVQEKIEELLGLNVEQFRQIVMLPQGEFKKLIESSTEEKERIFRKIFSSKIYKDFQDKLKDKSILMRRELEKYRDRRITLLQKIESGDNLKLKSLVESENMNIQEILLEVKEILEEDKKTLKKLEDDKINKTKEIEDKLKRIEKYKELNNKIQRISDLKLSLESLLSKEEEILSYEKKSLMAKKANEAKLLEENLIGAKNFATRKLEEKLLAQSLIEEKEKTLRDLSKELTLQESKEDERKSLEKKLHSLESQVNVFKEYEEKSYRLQEEEKILKTIEDSLRENYKLKQEKEVNLVDIESFLNENKCVEVDILSLEGKVKEKKEDLNLLRDFYKKIEVLKMNIEKKEELSKEYSIISSNYLKKNNYYEEKSEEIKLESAGILAKALVEGEPCLVCGSIHHPNKARVSASTLSEKELKVLKDDLEKVKANKEELLKSVTAVKVKIDEMLKGVILEGFKKFLGVDDFSIEEIDILQGDITNKGGAIRSELEKDEKELADKNLLLKAKSLKVSDREKILLSIQDVDREIKSLEIKNREVFAKCETLRESKKSLEKSINGEVSSLKELEILIQNTKKSISAMEESLRRIREVERKATIELTSAIKNLENKLEELKEAEIQVKSREEIFYDKLNSLGFTYEVFKESLLDSKDIDVIDNNIKEYRDELLTSREQIKVLEEETLGKEKIDTEEFENEKSILQEKLKEIENEEKIVYSRCDNNSKIVKMVEELSSGIGSKEEKYSIISELSNIANGFNPKKITFERYVLAHHFGEILEAANIRFKAMTNERYYLERKVDITDARKSQGLDFDVYDNYTGKTRSIKSLSGGESFKASLALALGLSDVIGASSGGVRIDTMFIDEGFGTLDPESLEKAIETLLELGAVGKVVGVISHVSELSERIMSRIEVSKDKKGSNIATCES
ncbi:AAA family ATPase [Clostridium cylindrosporum]|uniref:Nuclease SbcCD subunit C n=1 Tax=Clostridium cylindrosporum DSM 605 TaxID=1121307 RepID=A0A0J8DBU9_CLOCY|nr:AAA family ATPase [Clostridium cylindrosporum]KMT23342.1 nuclease SbcCD subunit C [Clostridium cylindrosporum DSM 605]